MKARLAVALLAVLAGAAFATAPLHKQRRGSDEEISIATFQGTWRVAGMMHTRKDGKFTPYHWNVTHIKVDGKSWSFQDQSGNGNKYTITIDNTKKPAAFLDFWNGEPDGGKAPGQGIIRRKGGVVEIIYVFGGNQRPVNFDEPPDGQYLLTLSRVAR